MPRGNGMGPEGLGPMTGRGAGYCASFTSPGFMSRPGGGRGWRNCYHATGLMGWQRNAGRWPSYQGEFQGTPIMTGLSREQQAEALRNQAGILEERLGTVRKRLEELSAETPQ
jgi:hypothetical protein